MTQFNTHKLPVVGSLLLPPVLNFFYLLADGLNNINFIYYGDSLDTVYLLDAMLLLH